MPGNPREMITSAERRFPVRLRLAVPPNGLGQRYTQTTAWLDENCGADGWAMTPSGMRGVLNDALSIYFADATLASAFVARWCLAAKVHTAGGVFQVREDEPESRSHGSEQGYIGRRESGDAYWNAERQAVEFGSRSESTVALSRSRGGCSNASDPPPSAASRRTTFSGRGSRASPSGSCDGAS